MSARKKNENAPKTGTIAQETPPELPESVPETPIIGTLNETSLHAALKKYIEPDVSRHEVPFCGSVADVLGDYGVVEIQSRGLRLLRKKIGRFLPHAPVRVVYPAPAQKHVYWIDPQNGDVSGGRRSPGKASIYTLWRELPAVEDFLGREGFSLTIMLLDWDEYKVLDGYGQDRKRRCSRVDRVLKGIEGEFTVSCVDDLKKLIPPGLSEGFTSRDFAKAARIQPKAAQNALRILHNHRFVQRIGRDKRGYLYKIMEGDPIP